MNSQNIFDVYGNQIKHGNIQNFDENALRIEFENMITNLRNGINVNDNFDEINVKLSDLKAEFEDKITSLKYEIDHSNNFLSLRNEFDDKIVNLKDGFNNGVQKLFTNLMTHIEKADKITEAIKVEKNYISLSNKKRIVGVKPSIDKHDVVIREQIEKPLKLAENIDVLDLNDPTKKNALDVKGRRISSVSKGIFQYDVIVKEQLDEHTNVFNDFKQHVKDSFNEIYEKLEDKRVARSVDYDEINLRITNLEQNFNKFKQDVDKTFENIDNKFNGLDD